MRSVGPLFLLALFFLPACKVARTSSDSKGERIETGVASWYGPGFHGKKTANGETFNTNAMTAAHRTLPFNTELRVVNVANGKTVNVRINDRGPYAKDRIIDLSKAAARKLEMIQAGTARVELFLLNRSTHDLNLDDIKKPTYAIQVGSFTDRSQAKAKASQFKDGWVKEAVVNRKKVFRVLIGKFKDEETARSRNSQLKARGITGFVKQVEN